MLVGSWLVIQTTMTLCSWLHCSFESHRYSAMVIGQNPSAAFESYDLSQRDELCLNGFDMTKKNGPPMEP